MPKNPFTSVASVPELMKFWDPALNTDDPSTVSITLRETRHWKCPDCGYPWQASVAGRAKAKARCPYHELGKAIWPGHNDLLTLYPEAADFYDFDKNQDIDIHSLGALSAARVNWRCPVCGYAWLCSVKSRVNAKFKCPCHEKNLVILPGINDAFTLTPGLEDWLDKDKLTDIDVHTLGVASPVPVPWKCPTCGREFESSILNRIQKEGERYVIKSCRNCYVTELKTAPFIAATPKLLRFWDFAKNKDYDPNLTSVSLKEKVWWRCKNCGYEWQAIPHSRLYSKNDQCPCCEAGIAVMPGFNDVVTLFPEILNTFDQEENPGIDLSTLAPGSNQVVTWTCKNCGNTWHKSIINRFRNKDHSYTLIGCQKCDSKGRRKQTYAEEFPELAVMFDEDRNGRTLASVTSTERTTVKFWWNCQKCHRPFEAFLVAVINGQARDSKGCPYCAHRRLIGGDSFAEVHPELMDEYDPVNEIDPYTVFPNTDKPAKWICRNNREHRWEATFAVRHMGYGNCPVCCHTRIVPGHTSFADVYPEYAERWSDKNELPPEKVFYDGRVWTQWDCPDCGGTYGAYTDDMVKGAVTCPFCDNKRPLAGFNSLADTHPEIIKLWSKKNERPPTSYLANTNVFVYLTCPDCGNDYGARIPDIVSGKSDCPFCHDRKPLRGFNTFKVMHPDLMQEWMYLNNYALADPDEILDSYSFPVWWSCPRSTEEFPHHYPMSPAQRIYFQERGREPCPYCKGRRRKKHHFI